MGDFDDERQGNDPEGRDSAHTHNARVFRRAVGRGSSRGRTNDPDWRSRESRDARGDNGGNWDGGGRGASRGRGRGFGGGRSDANRVPRGESGNKKVIFVPSQKVGRIIGKGGSKIRELEFESKTKIKIGDTSGEEADVTLSGTDEAIAECEELIKTVLEDFKPRQNRNEGYGGSSDGPGESFRRNEFYN